MRALKAKRGSRRRGVELQPLPAACSALANPDVPQADKNGSIAGVVTDEREAASHARASADDADALAKGLKRGLALRDEVLASAKAGELYRGEA